MVLLGCLHGGAGRGGAAPGDGCAADASREVHRHRIPLGLAMLEQGWITPDAAAFRSGGAAGSRSGRLGEWLVRQRSASEELVTRALGLQWSCPVLEDGVLTTRKG